MLLVNWVGWVGSVASGGAVGLAHGQHLSEVLDAAETAPPHTRAVAAGGRRRTAAAASTDDDFQPLRFRVATASLHRDSAEPNAGTCFASGEPHQRGIPKPDTQTCGGTELSCQGTCSQRDVMSATQRDAYIALVQRVVDEFQYLGLPAASAASGAAPLRLTRGVGRHVGHYRANGIPDADECARDCRLLSGWRAPDAWCDEGLNDTDVVVVLSYTAIIPGVLASGGACDYHPVTGRPIVIQVSWHQPLDASRTAAQLHAQYSGIVKHELFHGLGFLLSQFRASGVVTPHLFTDKDGSSDAVWSFPPWTHVAQAAGEFFDCNNTQSLYVPLMHYPELGRGQHWPGRIAHDDVLSYGHAVAVSVLTLAAFEDLNVGYAVNYNATECAAWGRAQGCAFLTSRCGVGRHDHSVAVSSSAECRSPDGWVDLVDQHLDTECALGADPCGSAAYDAATGRCDAQCAASSTATNRTCVPHSHTGWHTDDHHHHSTNELGLDTGELAYAIALFVGVAVLVGAVLWGTLNDYESL